jgi:tetratricopeptide (TPR) repeat protein
MPGSSRLAAVACLGALLGAVSLAGPQAPAASARDVYARARALQKEGNASAALALLWEAAGLAPDDAELQNGLGEALERIGALEAAVDAYRRAASARPAFEPAINNLTLALVQSGKGPEAVARARELVAAAPADPERHYTLGLALSEQDVSDAITSFRRVLELAPRHTLARYNLALVLKRTDRLAEAERELLRILEIESRPEAHYMLGVIYWHEGRLDRASSALRSAVAADPRHADAYIALGAIAKAQRDSARAADALRRAVEIRPDLPGAHYTLAQVLESAGETSAAGVHFDAAARLRERAKLELEASVWTYAGMKRLDGGDSIGAIDHFRRATMLFDAYAPAHYHLGRALARLGELDASRAAFARAHRLNPSLVAPDPRP